MFPLTPRFRELIEERIGLDLSRREERWCQDLLLELASEDGGTEPAVFLEALEKEATESALWAPLLERLTVAETYFFRDLGQMELLRHQILPALRSEVLERPLRIWSAGCSTGEELYSIAMLLDFMGTPADLVGTDVNPAVLEVARRAVYRERSLRGFPKDFRDRYLRPVAGGFEVSPRLKERARFVAHNLRESFHSLGLFDLIVCRNVLIYFSRERLTSLLESFHMSLRPGGVLLTGHGELMGVTHPFEAVHYPESVIYRRRGRAHPPPTERAPSAVRARDLRLPSLGVIAAEEIAPPEVTSLCRLGRAARLAGDREKARKLLRQALYLDPDSIPVFLEKSLLWVEEDPGRAKKDFATALALLANKPQEWRLAEDVALPLAELESLKF